MAPGLDNPARGSSRLTTDGEGERTLEAEMGSGPARAMGRRWPWPALLLLVLGGALAMLLRLLRRKPEPGSRAGMVPAATSPPSEDVRQEPTQSAPQDRGAVRYAGARFVDVPPPSVLENKVDLASWESFPASDAPPWR